MVEITLDKPRTLKYRWPDLRDLSRRLNGASLSQLFTRLGEADPDAVSMALMVGLRHQDGKLTLDKVDELIQGFFDGGGKVADLLNAITEAIQSSGVVRAVGGGEENAARPS